MREIINELFSYLKKYTDLDSLSYKIIDKRNSISEKIVLVKNGIPKFMVKVTPIDYYIRSYELISFLYERGAPFAKPLCGFIIPNTRNYCLVTEWVDGFELNQDTFQDRFKIYPYSNNFAKTLHKLHNLKVDYKFPRVSIEDEIELYLKKIFDSKIDFLFKKDFLTFLQNNVHLVSKHDNNFVHMDVHIHNIIWSYNKSATLIDYENIMITDYYREFVYAVGFHDSFEDIFWFVTIFIYFNGKIPKDFWEKTRFYSIVHLLRMIIFESRENNQNKINWLCKSIYKKYNELNCIEPNWFIKYKPYIPQLESELDSIIDESPIVI